MEEVLKFIPIIFLSAVKFLPAPTLAIVAGFSFLESILITCSGGLAGVVTFYRSSEYLMERARKKKAAKLALGIGKPSLKFTRMNRFLVKLKHRFGIVGIALLTPAILSIPFGSIVMAKFFKHSHFAMPALMIAVAVWSFLLTFLTVKFGLLF